jgi:hypothetical protein
VLWGEFIPLRRNKDLGHQTSYVKTYKGILFNTFVIANSTQKNVFFIGLKTPVYFHKNGRRQMFFL